MRVARSAAWLGLALAVSAGASWASWRIVRAVRLRPAPRPGFLVIRPPHEVSALVLDGDVVWAGGREGLYRIDRRSGRVLGTVDADRPLTYVRALLLDGPGSLWVAHAGGLTRIAAEGVRTLTQRDGLPDDRVNCLMRSREGALWVGTWGGAARLDAAGVTVTVLRQRDGLLHDMVNVMLEDDAGGLWFGSYVAPAGGLTRWHAGRFQHWTVASGLPHNSVSALHQDRQGAVWAATGFSDRGGAARLERTDGTWRVAAALARQDGLAGDKVRSVLQDSSGVYWFGSEYDGIACWDGARFVRLTVADGLSSWETKVIVEDADGSLWLGTDDGVTRIDRSGRAGLGLGTLAPDRNQPPRA